MVTNRGYLLIRCVKREMVTAFLKKAIMAVYKKRKSPHLISVG
jgi:hypothetical protein